MQSPLPFKNKTSLRRTFSSAKVGDIVLLTQSRVGVIRYIGYVNGKSQSQTDKYIGIEIRITDGFVGDNNGTFNNVTYFQCAQDAGIFVEPHQILQIYTPENLLDMVINLKDKLLPLMASTSSDKHHQKKSVSISNNTTYHRSKNAKSPPKSNNNNAKWPSFYALNYIQEDNDHDDYNSPPPPRKPRKPRKPPSKIKIKVNNKTPVPKHLPKIAKHAYVPPKHVSISSNGSFTSSGKSSGNVLSIDANHQYKKSAPGSQFDDIDMQISAPIGVMSYFSAGADRSNSDLSSNPNQSPVSYTSPTTIKNPYIYSPKGNKRLSVLRYHSTDFSMNMSGMSGNFDMIASYSKIKLLQRCITLRKKDKNTKHKTIVIDLASFGSYLIDENISTKHKWYDSIWNKYDKLFTLKIEFYFVNELISDLLNEYLLNKYDNNINIDNIMSVDIKQAIQQIIIHIRPYHIDAHQSMSGWNLYDIGGDNDSDTDEMPFTFKDFCDLGNWLHEIEEMEEDDNDVDYFLMDIHYFDFVQYITSHKKHVWKKVINKKLNNNKNNKNIKNVKNVNNNKKKTTSVITKFDISSMYRVIELLLYDYGRNGLGNLNMSIYSQQIKEYAKHIKKLFDECKQDIIKKKNKKNVKFITKKQFFQFISVIPSL